MRTFYITLSGDGDGLTEQTPISLSRIKQTLLKDGDVLLFKKGERFHEPLTYNKPEDARIVINNYGLGTSLPTFRNAKYVTNQSLWQQHDMNIYKIDLRDPSIDGSKYDGLDVHNVGFLFDEATENKYPNRKLTIEELENQFDFYCDDLFVYVYSTINPNALINRIGFALNGRLITVRSNTKVSGLKAEYCGGHGILGYLNPKNVEIRNNIINDVGGSLLSNGRWRYGNGVEFFNSGENVLIEKNHIKRCYDVGVTTQGRDIKIKDTVVRFNVFEENSQDIEVWTERLNSSISDTSYGILSLLIEHNISINQGRGWGYDVRPDKNKAAFFEMQHTDLFNLNIIIRKNTIYNPRRVFYFNGEYEEMFKKITSHSNTIHLKPTSYIINDQLFSNDYEMVLNNVNKEKNSKVYLLEDIISKENIIENTLGKIGFVESLALNSLNFLNSDTPYIPEKPRIEPAFDIPSNGSVLGFIPIGKVKILNTGAALSSKIRVTELLYTQALYCEVLFHVKQETALPNIPAVSLQVVNKAENTYLGSDSFRAVINNDEVILYIKYNKSHMLLQVSEEINVKNDRIQFDFLKNQTLIGVLPTGTVIESI